MRTHESHIAFYLINAVDFGFTEHDICLNVMPLCHINSTFFTFTFTYIGASVYIHPAQSFRAAEILEIIEREKITFISLIPTHYNLILNTTEDERKQDVSSIRKLLCSSAPVRKSMKLAIMDFFPGVELYEGYGSTEAGIVTVLKPEHQMSKLGSIGFESLGTDFVKLLNVDGEEVGVGEVGNCIPADRCCSRNTTSCRRKPRQRSGTAGFRPVTWPGGEPTGFMKSSTARTT